MNDQAEKLRRLVNDKSAYTSLSPRLKDSVQPSSKPEAAADSGPRTIAITSGKGGVGKTNLSVNLAIALGKLGKRVVIIDADMGMANVDILLGTSSRISLMNLVDPDVSLEDVLLRGPYSVSYIAGGSGMEHASELSPSERVTLFRKLSACSEWADLILIDTGAGIGKNVLDFIVAADEVLLVTTPEPTALTDAYAVMKGYSKIKDRPNLKLVVNRVFDDSEVNNVVAKLQGTADRFLGLKVEKLGYVYDDPALARAVRNQVPVLVAHPDSISSRCITSIAESILRGGQQKVKLGWRGFLKRIFGTRR